MSGGIKLGSCLFTVVEPQRGRSRAYHEWYERDHFYAGMMAMPHVFAGRRWAAPARLKALSGVADGTFLATYWIEADRHSEFLDAAVAALRELQAAGRMFEGRDHVHTGFYELDSWAEREAGGVPPEVALDHPFPGLVAVLGGDEPSPESAVALRLTWEPLATPGFDTGGDALHLLFLDADPEDVWAEVDATLGGTSGAGATRSRVRWVRAFVPTIPGAPLDLDSL